MSATGYLTFWMRPEIHCGVGALIRLQSLLQAAGAKRVLLLSDQGIKQAGLVDKVVNLLSISASGNLPELVGVYDQIKPDAGSVCINSATAYARKVSCDAIVALGGGSVLDAAKGVKYALGHQLSDIGDVLVSGLRVEVSPPAKALGIPHIAIPTTAGTGAEVTAGAIILNEKTGIKCGLMAPYLEADTVILDAQLTLGLPASITADTGMDALTHAIEAIANPNANHFTDAHAITAAGIIELNLPTVIADGTNLNARNSMLQASSMACNAMTNALGPFPIHNCAHALGALYHIPHGRANGVLLPAVLEVLGAFYLPNAHRLAKALNINFAEQSAENILATVIQRIRTLQKQVNMPSNFSAFAIDKTHKTNIRQTIMADPAYALFQIPAENIDEILDLVIP